MCLQLTENCIVWTFWQSIVLKPKEDIINTRIQICTDGESKACGLCKWFRTLHCIGKEKLLWANVTLQPFVWKSLKYTKFRWHNNCVRAADSLSSLELQHCFLCTARSSFHRVFMSLLCAWQQKGASPRPPACQEKNYAHLQGQRRAMNFLQSTPVLQPHHPSVCSKNCPL